MPTADGFDDEAPAGDESAELVVIPDEFGAIVSGTDAAVEEFLADYPGLAVLPISESKSAIGEAASVAGVKKPVSRFVLGSALWREFGSPSSGTRVTYHRMVRSSSTGRIIANPRIAAPGALAGGTAAVAPAAMFALEQALQALSEQIEQHLERIEDKVDEILRLASAQRLGDVYGHQRLLRRRVKALEDGEILTQTDWSSVAALGADLEVGVERLRFHAMQLTSTLQTDAPAEKRADQLADIVSKGRLAETLQLLLVAQSSLFLWQRLRLEQVRRVEPDHLDQTITSARATIREQFDLDRELAGSLRRLLDTHAVLRVPEVHHILAGRKLTKYRGYVVAAVDDFIAARNLQVEEWSDVRHATLNDAWSAVRRRGVETVNSGRRQIARSAGAVASWVEPKTADDGAEAATKGESEDPGSSTESTARSSEPVDLTKPGARTE